MQYVEALLADLDTDLNRFREGRPIESIFMGGGTPSLFSPAALAALLKGLTKSVELSADCEITLEANPGTFESAKFQAFRSLGVNRLSIGIQSFNDKHLRKLGRVHNAEEARRAVAIAKRAGFENLNLDLMFGLPEQTTEEALADVETAIALQPTHISFYQLTLEPNTYFHKFPPSLPEDEDIFAIQMACQPLLFAQGFRQYEISAYAKDGFQCRHNSNYWQFGDYLGIGAGAHGKITSSLPDRITRTTKTRHPDQYLSGQSISVNAIIETDHLPLEFVMNHLRLKHGFELDHFQAVTGLSPDKLEPALSHCIDLGLLVRQQNKIFCSERGWHFLDEILEKFVP
jgi:putative oxygen-independent coproporphyrinogen III oxidase